MQLRALTSKELPWLVSVAEVCGPLQHPEVRPRRVGELDEYIGHVEHLQGTMSVALGTGALRVPGHPVRCEGQQLTKRPHV